MPPTTGSSAGGRSTGASRPPSSAPPLPSGGLGGRSLQRDGRFLLCFGVVPPSRPFDRERERLLFCPRSLPACRPRSACTGVSDLSDEEKAAALTEASSVQFTQPNSPISRGSSTEVWQQHLQLLHSCCCNPLIFFTCGATWNLMTMKRRDTFDYSVLKPFSVMQRSSRTIHAGASG